MQKTPLVTAPPLATRDAIRQMSEVLNVAQYSNTRTPITRKGKVIAYVVPPDYASSPPVPGARKP